MTLGERILQKRKELGLSQEGLGERMDVSRQIVYKWESDQAVPELNKLLQLSQLFAVSIGWLIAGEDTQTNDGANADASEKLAKILEQSSRAPSKRSKYILICAFLLLIAALAAGSLKLNQLERRFESLNYAVQNIDRNTQAQVDKIATQVQSILGEYSSLTADHLVEVTDMDLLDNSISLRLSALPKTYTDGMQARFHLECDQKTYDVDGTLQDGNHFTAEVTVPIAMQMQISVEFISGEIHETQVMQTYLSLFMDTFAQVSLSASPLSINGDTNSDDISVQIDNQDSTVLEQYGHTGKLLPSTLTDVSVFLTENGNKIADYVTTGQIISEGSNGVILLRYHPENGLPKLDPDSTYQRHVILTDSYGQQMETIFDTDGNSTSEIRTK